MVFLGLLPRFLLYVAWKIVVFAIEDVGSVHRMINDASIPRVITFSDIFPFSSLVEKENLAIIQRGPKSPSLVKIQIAGLRRVDTVVGRSLDVDRTIVHRVVKIDFLTLNRVSACASNVGRVFVVNDST